MLLLFYSNTCFYSLDQYRFLLYAFFLLVGGRRAKGLISDICVLVIVNAKGFPCVPSEEESCDKKVRLVPENSVYVFLSTFINPIILACVLADTKPQTKDLCQNLPVKVLAQI